MFTVSVRTHFRASHQLVLPDGSRERAHNHNWSVTADVSSQMLDSKGVVIDFHQLKATVDNIVAGLDNMTLGNVEYFQCNNPSAENVAKYIYDKLEPRLPNGLKLQSIEVMEEPGCSAKFAN